MTSRNGKDDEITMRLVEVGERMRPGQTRAQTPILTDDLRAMLDQVEQRPGIYFEIMRGPVEDPEKVHRKRGAIVRACEREQVYEAVTLRVHREADGTYLYAVSEPTT